MKIEGPNKAAGAKGVSKTGAKKSVGDTAFSDMVGGEEAIEGQKALSGVMNIGQLDALLSLQEAEGGTSEEAAKKSKKRAAALLDQLDKVRIGLLTGSMPESTLTQLTHMVQSHREKAIDPKLAEILDEIDLRAQVELAKLERMK